MSPEQRIVAALKVLAAIRSNIAANGNRYSGSMVPNLQSAFDVLVLPASVIEPSLVAAPEFAPTDVDVATLRTGWTE